MCSSPDNAGLTTPLGDTTLSRGTDAGEAGPHDPTMIRVRGAATHNLKEVDLDLPRNRLIAFCGASGSGKTSMAIDTLYAEGQRRYIESFSPYTRQFLQQLDKPDYQKIEGLPPAIAVTRASGSRSNRATVATATEIADHLRLLFARAGRLWCSTCNAPVRRDTIDSIVDALRELPEGTRAMLGFEVELGAQPADRLAELIEAGYVRALVEGEVTELATLAQTSAPPAQLIVVVDRFVGGRIEESRLGESIETALDGGAGCCLVIVPAATDPSSAAPEPLRFDTRLRCAGCDESFVQPEPQLLNFNSPLGACESCEGFGSVVELDMGLVVPDRAKSLAGGAIAPWTTPAYAHELEELLALAPDYGIPTNVPFEELSDEAVQRIVQGVPERDFGGLNGFVSWLERRKYKMHLRVFLSRWRSYRPCPACDGARLRPEALAVRIGTENLASVMHREVREAVAWLEALLQDESLDPAAAAIALPIVEEALARGRYLVQVGLGYLTLDRTLRTLSTGELGRVAMTATLGSNLVEMLYVLDEPSVGLHPADALGLVRAIERLRDRGNTVVVVEHEESLLRAADQLVEFGPHAGAEGGEIVYAGPTSEIVHCPESRTGDWLAGRRISAATAANRRPTDQGRLSIAGATGANLGGNSPEGLDVSFPLGVLCVITGVSGAGKSSLVRRTLYPALSQRLHDRAKSAGEAKSDHDRPLPLRDLTGIRQLDDVILVDQSPIGRSPRSNPVTYLKVFDPIRELFAEQPDAKARGFKASHFSFNVDGGRCDACQGAGHIEVDMQFLADIYMRCGECDGQRYRHEVLEVRHRGRNIAEVLDMTVLEAFRFFRGQPKVQSRLQPLIDVGLEYLQLGQSATTLSSGEAQRLKLAGRLASKGAARTLFVMDEPTTGLHFSDVERLTECFGALLDVGHSLVVIEHNLQMMMAADWIIDLGPGASAEGGRIVVEGTPEQVAACKASATGRALAEAFAQRDAALAELEREEALLADEP
ncbi:excinuclease ABC subunit UvrA [Botrimarina hoheduenensis]|uniref:UvrABC system protein A n=1 Tax=Botrimarina hoheduenensis TaxID=2528000 RepID=A0A5C5VZB1_9BACT|nr:excinuclease ABC subunit UvrA [Botrimarina hoheduenensis]TWT43313.1 UvrABC system protein A [Botrimarina hoheduenensis]